MEQSRHSDTLYGNVPFGEGQQALYTLRSYDAGDVIQVFMAGSVHEAPTSLTVQREEKEHLTLQPPSCNTVTTAAIRIASSTPAQWRSSPLRRCNQATN
jgi:hypothetical protein